MLFAGRPPPLIHPRHAGPVRPGRATLATLALALGLAATTAAAFGSAVDRYQARYDPGSGPGEEKVVVRACFAGAAPEGLRRHR
ncbi:MAG: hypothetical protein P8008_06420, partial [Gammaproteobacteria bacterium]